MSKRGLMWARMVVGLLFMWQGLMHVKELVLDHNFELRAMLDASQGWTVWPIAGGLRPMELALWTAGLEFALGMFVFGGLLTRVSALVLVFLSALWLQVSSQLGAGLFALHGVLLLGALLITWRGGGAHTMDSELGRMQQRTLEREAERETLRAAARNGGA